MDQLQYVTITLFFVSVALSAVFFLAWLTFDRQKHALTWSICFGVAAIQWFENIARGSGIIPFDVYWATANLIGPTVPVIALVGYRQRANLPISGPAMAMLSLIPFFIIMWTTYVQPHFGISTAAMPFQGVITSLLAAHTLYRSKGSPTKIEWAAIICYLLLACDQFWLGSVGLSNGVERIEATTELYNRILFISMPGFFTLLGLIALLIIASDLASKVKALANAQKQEHQAESEQNKDTLQDAIEAMPDLVAISDKQGNHLTCNDSFARALGLSKRELLGKSAQQITHLYRRFFLSIDGEMVASDEIVVEKLLHALKTGERLNVITHDSRTFILGLGYLSSGGQILVARDVTQLNQARSRLETAIHAMPIGFAYFEKDRVIACNASYERLIRKDRDWIAKQSSETLIKTVLKRLTNENSEEELQQGLQSVLKAIHKRHYFNRILKFNNGSWYDISIHPVPDRGFITIATDITKRRLLEIGVEENEAKLREILGNQPFPVLVVRTSDSRAIFASNAAKEALGEKTTVPGPDEIPGSEPAIQFRTAIEHLIQSLPGQSHSLINEVSLKRANEELFPALLSSQDVYFSGEPAKVISFIDISTIKNLQHELETQREALFQSEKLNALGNLLAGVAHELNNPLTVIVANAHVLLKTSDDDNAANRLQNISHAAERCSKIIRSFLDMARKDPGEVAAFEVSDCINQALEVSNLGLRIHEIRIEADIEPNLPSVLGHRDQFVQVILNLIINAQQALDGKQPPRQINLLAKLNANGTLIVIDIIDNGPGISEEARDRIFEPYFTTKNVGEGTGMGLSMARGILKSHGGTIHLLDSKTSSGTHFQILLPHTDSLLQSDEESNPQDREIPRQKKRVLIVDDEPEVVSALGDVIALEGHQVKTVSSAIEALEILEENYFDLILSDIRMPEMDGEQFFGHLKNRFPVMASKTAFITGNDLSQDTLTFLESCERPYLGKPFMPEDISTLIKDIEQQS